VKKEKNATKEALDSTAFAEFFSGLGWGQAGAIHAVLGIVGDDGHCPKHSMNPGSGLRSERGRPLFLCLTGFEYSIHFIKHIPPKANCE
jgi:hypothetical protein